MKTVEQVMSNAICIDAGKSVADATALMLNHDVSVLPVLTGDRLLGLITMRELIRALPYRPVVEVMQHSAATVPKDTPVTAAYALMEREKIGHLSVVDGDRFAGLITIEAALRALGEPLDPLTGLPWAAALRQRAVEYLKDGREIAIIFIDLDNFGLINKHFSHVVGDRWIQAVARALNATVDSSRDLLCRYGGDEFAILTLRRHEEAEALGRGAVEAVGGLRVTDPAARVALTASMGLSGGKRTTEREDIHFEATVDDLITIASRQTTRAKLEKWGRVAGAIAAAEPRLRVVRVTVITGDEEVTATVELALGTEHLLGEAKGPSPGVVPWRVLAEATAQAVNRALPDDWRTVIDEVRVIRTGMENLAAVTVRLEQAGRVVDRRSGYVPSDGDAGAAVVKATLQAVNRPLGRLLREPGPA